MSTIERWAAEYIRTTSLAHKLAPPPRPEAWEDAPLPVRIERPGRPSELRPLVKHRKSSGKKLLNSERKRAQLVHTFAHHELQAAELMAWAFLAFADAPRAFRVGLLGILDDEVKHLCMYCTYLAKSGVKYGDFEVRDWFWERVPAARTAAEFVAVMGMGFEAGNLDHTERFASRFRAVGDLDGARMMEQIGEEEVPHVRFALHWFGRLTDAPVGFAEWRARLPPPLSPLTMRGNPLDRPARMRAGYTESFLDDLAAWEPIP